MGLEYTIRLIAQSGPDLDATFELERDGANCNLTCTFGDHTLVAREPDFFTALCKVRRKLEAMGLRPHCYGASLNAYPSAMSRDMGNGLSLYRTEIGKPGDRAHIARTFETGDDVVPSTVDEQYDYHRRWFDSLGQRNA